MEVPLGTRLRGGGGGGEHEWRWRFLQEPGGGPYWISVSSSSSSSLVAPSSPGLPVYRWTTALSK